MYTSCIQITYKTSSRLTKTLHDFHPSQGFNIPRFTSHEFLAFSAPGRITSAVVIQTSLEELLSAGQRSRSQGNWSNKQHLGGGSKNIGFLPPNHPLKNKVFHYKSSILEYPYFWKHPPPFSPHDIPVSTTSHLKQPTSTPLQHNMLKVPGKVTCSKLWL